MDSKVKMKQLLQVVCLGLLLEVFLQGKKLVFLYNGLKNYVLISGINYKGHFL